MLLGWMPEHLEMVPSPRGTNPRARSHDLDRDRRQTDQHSARSVTPRSSPILLTNDSLMLLRQTRRMKDTFRKKKIIETVRISRFLSREMDLFIIQFKKYYW